MRLIFTLAWRELRGGVRDFRIFLGCLAIGVAVIAGVNTISNHIENGIRREAKTLLGGDVQITLTNGRLTQEQNDFITQYGRLSLTVSLRAMATYGENTALVELKGVDAAYPLLGKVQLANNIPLQQTLKESRIVVEQALLDRLEAHKGDRLILGNNNFTIADVIEKEPDRITGPLTLGPRVLVSISDLEKYHFLLPGNLIRYNYHVLLNDPTQLQLFTSALSQHFPKAPWIVKTSNDNNRGVQNFVDRLQLFMTLAGLSTLLIGGIGIANATETYLSKKSRTIAILKTLGASRSYLFLLYVTILCLIAFAGALVGAVSGSLLSYIALPYLAEFLPVFDSNVTMDYTSIGLAIGFGILTVFTFSIAPLSRGMEVKPASLLRGSDVTSPRLSLIIFAINSILAAILMIMLILFANDRKIAIGFIGAALASFVIFTFAAHITKYLARKIYCSVPWARLAIANIYRPGSHTLSMMLSIGIGLTVLIALSLVEGNFQREVEDTLPTKAPSLFLIDIQPVQKDEFIHFLQSKPFISDISSQPMIRGRIAKLKDIPVEKVAINPEAKWAIDSDRGITYATLPPPNAHIVKGLWWRTNYQGRTLLSLDRKLADGMGLRIGDTITLNILGQDIDAEIANLREVNYITFQINFSMILSPGIIEDFPSTTIATIRIDGAHNETALIHEIAERFPTISTIRIKDSLEQIRDIISHIAMALRLSAVVTLLAGMLVLASALSATLDKRIYDTVMLRVLGADKTDIIKMFLSEWLGLSIITALIACALGSMGAWLILQRLDWIEFHFLPGNIISITILVLLAIATAGLLIHWRVFNTKASALLRNE